MVLSSVWSNYSTFSHCVCTASSSMAIVVMAQNMAAILNVSASATMWKRWKLIRNHFCTILKHINNLNVIQNGIECDHQSSAQTMETTELCCQKLFCMNSINQLFMNIWNKRFIIDIYQNWTMNQLRYGKMAGWAISHHRKDRNVDIFGTTFIFRNSQEKNSWIHNLNCD